jgi:hypothetical protein
MIAIAVVDPVRYQMQEPMVKVTAVNEGDQIQSHPKDVQ